MTFHCCQPGRMLFDRILVHYRKFKSLTLTPTLANHPNASLVLSKSPAIYDITIIQKSRDQGVVVNHSYAMVSLARTWGGREFNNVRHSSMVNFHLSAP
ncbi:hypothetical protein EmuJ_000062900 [Echinococcus multilocularis]|uniref:Uncharacterized protein n=1 Tax=Echinococcus multilocularis TaxID=6211 RepID=A0A087VX90_ECHMU|nr:hypothetical protein EmuJ_000062900 [Echinococcus multilocularis]